MTLKQRGRKRAPTPGNPMIVFCRRLPQVTEDVKWGHDLVFSVGGKMFAAFDLNDPRRCSFKTTPDDFEILTALPGIGPAPYAARFHWVSLERRNAIAAGDLKLHLRRAHSLVSSRLPLRLRRSLGLEGLPLDGWERNR
jgi:predicted DNA-binding protein (MmcQ/YjbR family)